MSEVTMHFLVKKFNFERDLLTKGMSVKLFRFFSVCVFLLMICTIGFAQPGAKAAKEAAAAQKSGNLQLAITKYQEAIAAEPNNHLYYAKLATVYTKLKPPKNDDAIKALQDAVAKNPKYTAGYARIGALMTKKKEYSEAVKAYSEAFKAEEDPTKKINYKIKTANIYLKNLNNPQSALNEISEIKSLAGDDIRVIKIEGDALFSMENWSGAVTAYKKAVEKAEKDLPPGKPQEQYYLALAKALLKSGDRTQAEQVAKKLDGVAGTTLYKRYESYKKSQGAKAMISIANSYVKAGGFDEAQPFVQKALEAKDDNIFAFRFQASMLQKQGKTTEAVAALQKAVEEAEKSGKKENLLPLYNQLLRLQEMARDYTGMANSVDKIMPLIKEESKIKKYYEQKIYAQILANDYAGAQATATAAMNKYKDPAAQSAYNFYIAMAAKKSGDSDKAMKAFQKVTSGSFKKAAAEEMKKMSKG